MFIKKLINFTKLEDDLIHKLMKITGLTYSDIVRRAVDDYLHENLINKETKP